MLLFIAADIGECKFLSMFVCFLIVSRTAPKVVGEFLFDLWHI